MPTIIDELVTIVRLDPRPFSEGQRQVTAELGRLKSATQSAANTVQQQASKPLRSYMADLHSELKDVNLQLFNLQSTARRSGQGVRAGGMAGAEGLNNLAAAGLAAFAAVKSVQEVIGKLGEVSRGAFNTAYTSRFANVPQDWLQQLQIANQVVGNVPHERTQSALLALENARATFRNTGQFPTEFQGMARWFAQNLPGVDLAHAPIQEIFSGIAQGARGRNGPDLLMQLQASGLGDFATLFSSGRYGSAMQGAGNLTLSDKQIESLNNLGEAARRASEAWDKLIGSITAAHPEWGQTIENFTKLTTAISNNEKQVYALGTAVQYVFGYVMIKAIEKFLAFLGARIPLGRLFGIFSLPAVLSGDTPGAGQRTPEEEAYDKSHFFGGSIGRFINRVFGWDKEEPKASSSTGAGPIVTGNAASDIAATIAAAGGNAQTQAALLSNFDPESLGLKSTAVNPNSGATGYAQWLGSRLTRLRQIAASMGVPVTDPKAQLALMHEEMTGPYKNVIQRMNNAPDVTSAAEIGLRGYEGVNPDNSLVAGAPWSVMLDTHVRKAKQYLASLNGAALGSDPNATPSPNTATPSPNTATPSPNTATNTKSLGDDPHYYEKVNKMSLADAIAQQNLIFAVQTQNARSAAGVSSSISNDNSVENNVHAPVTLNPPPGSDGLKWGSAFGEGLRRSMIVNHANAGTGG